MWAVNQEPGMPGTGEPEVARPVHQPSLMDAIVPLVTLAVLIAGSLLLLAWMRSMAVVGFVTGVVALATGAITI